jgi:hypothetical protein
MFFFGFLFFNLGVKSMAKKSAAATVPAPQIEQPKMHLASNSEPIVPIKSFTEPGKGRRLCAECDREGRKDKYATARGSVCVHGHDKPESTAPAASTKTRKVGSGTDPEKLAMEFVLFESSGSVDKALKAVENYSEDGLAKFVSDCGGADNAKKILEALANKANR